MLLRKTCTAIVVVATFGVATSIVGGESLLYWADQGTDKIRRANLDGSSPTVVANLAAGSNPTYLAVDVVGAKMYWNNSGNGTLRRANLSDGSNVQTLATAVGSQTFEGLVIAPFCPGDATGDNVVNVLDLVQILLCFGDPATPPCDTGQDINNDGIVNMLDLVALLLAFGTTCP